jgi:hypothetical protein
VLQALARCTQPSTIRQSGNKIQFYYSLAGCLVALGSISLLNSTGTNRIKNMGTTYACAETRIAHDPRSLEPRCNVSHTSRLRNFQVTKAHHGPTVLPEMGHFCGTSNAGHWIGQPRTVRKIEIELYLMIVSAPSTIFHQRWVSLSFRHSRCHCRIVMVIPWSKLTVLCRPSPGKQNSQKVSSDRVASYANIPILPKSALSAGSSLRFVEQRVEPRMLGSILDP